MSKKIAITILTIIILAIGLEWCLFRTGKILYTLMLGFGAFLGFYASEIAKKAVRARQISNQAHAYVINFDVLQKLDIFFEKLEPQVQEWNMAIDKGDIDRIEIDKEFRDKLFALYDDQNRLSIVGNALSQQKNIPGKIDNILSTLDMAQDELKSWSKYLSDEDIALLGPDILLEAISYRTSQIQSVMNLQGVYRYLKNTAVINSVDIKEELQKTMYFVVRTRVSLARLKILVEAAKVRGLLQHTKALLG